ncbi:hypothetical protein EJ06DRAFT_429543 [Trichodelitschia bisporula]|uniref:Uncharacterized protein n=1 Tax=Trichodelitschia bisporula TaxID=703511 RepID=A0A6G1HX23_9PEZI|nr:hypothetical protein EJ06DRAFT_429543 [Trichodelitschia bisporula]
MWKAISFIGSGRKTSSASRRSFLTTCLSIYSGDGDSNQISSFFLLLAILDTACPSSRRCFALKAPPTRNMVVIPSAIRIDPICHLSSSQARSISEGMELALRLYRI